MDFLIEPCVFRQGLPTHKGAAGSISKSRRKLRYSMVHAQLEWAFLAWSVDGTAADYEGIDEQTGIVTTTEAAMTCGREIA